MFISSSSWRRISTDRFNDGDKASVHSDKWIYDYVSLSLDLLLLDARNNFFLDYIQCLHCWTINAQFDQNGIVYRPKKGRKPGKKEGFTNIYCVNTICIRSVSNRITWHRYTVCISPFSPTLRIQYDWLCLMYWYRNHLRSFSFFLKQALQWSTTSVRSRI